MSDKKIIFLDVDGTLIDYNAIMPSSAGRAVDEARKNGHLVYICTGCSKAEILQRDLCELDGMIGGNGAYVEDHGEVIMHQGLTVEEVKHIVDWCNERHLGFYLEANSGMYCNDYMLEQGPETMKKYALGKGADETKAKTSAESFVNTFIHLPTEQLYRDDINKISFILSSYQDHLDSKEEFPELIANTWGGKDEQALYGDLSPKGITKKHAIDVLDSYRSFYQDRIDHGLKVDRNGCPYTTDTLNDISYVKRSMLTNPFEKFERKRFMYYSKDLKMLSINHALFSRMNAEDWKVVENQMREDLNNYYQNI